MRKFTTAEVQAIIEADRAGRIHLEPRDYTETTLAAALKQYRDLPMVGTEAHPGYQHAWGKNDLCIYKGCKAGPAELEAEYQAAKSARDRQDCETPAGMEAARAAARSLIAEMEQPTPELPAPFLVMDDSDDSAHGTFETWGEARGCIAYDHLSKWTIYRAGQIVERSATA